MEETELLLWRRKRINRQHTAKRLLCVPMRAQPTDPEGLGIEAVIKQGGSPKRAYQLLCECSYKVRCEIMHQGERLGELTFFDDDESSVTQGERSGTALGVAASSVSCPCALAAEPGLLAALHPGVAWSGGLCPPGAGEVIKGCSDIPRMSWNVPGGMGAPFPQCVRLSCECLPSTRTDRDQDNHRLR